MGDRKQEQIDMLQADNERLQRVRDAAAALHARMEPRSKHGIADEWWALDAALADTGETDNE